MVAQTGKSYLGESEAVRMPLFMPLLTDPGLSGMLSIHSAYKAKLSSIIGSSFNSYNVVSRNEKDSNFKCLRGAPQSPDFHSNSVGFGVVSLEFLFQ